MAHGSRRRFGYGAPIAVASAYADEVYDLECATIIYLLGQQKLQAGEITHEDFWVWVRDLKMDQAADELFGEEGEGQIDAEERFADEVYEKKQLDPRCKSGEKLILIQEGYEPEQTIFLNKGHCTKCLCSLHDLCQDY